MFWKTNIKKNSEIRYKLSTVSVQHWKVFCTKLALDLMDYVFKTYYRIKNCQTFHWHQPASKSKGYRNITTGLSQRRITCCINVPSATRPSSQVEHALNWESMANRLTSLRGLEGHMSNSLYFHGSSFHSLMEWNMFEY